MSRSLLLAAAAVLLAGACATRRLPAPVAPPSSIAPSPPPAPFEAGAAAADITPPPGVSTFGLGPDSLVSEGVWTRLQCRAFVLRQGATAMALVPCDLAASSTLLQRSIAARLAATATSACPALPATRIFLSATHTHAGPAHYFDGAAYDGPDSAHMPGFDPAMVDFLAGRIARAICDAETRLAPAELREAHYEDGEPCPTGDCGLWGIARNRSPQAHARDAADPPAPPGVTGPEAAIDPSLHWIELRQATSHAPMGAIALFAMHPTVLPRTNRLLGADVDGIVSRLLEADLGAAGCEPPVGVINTNEGDVSPIWSRGTKEEAALVAERIASRLRALRAREADWSSSIRLDARYQEIELRDQPTSDGGRTCKRAELGESTAFGACDHPSSDAVGPPLPLPPCGACQVPKLTPMGELEWLLSGAKRSFPTREPVGLVRLGHSWIASVPAELTVSAGRLVRRAVAEVASDPGSHVVISGLTNGYILYVASEAEYGWTGAGGGCPRATDGRTRQSYEGSSTLYGPKTARLLGDHLATLARTMVAGTRAPGIDEAVDAPYDVGPERARLPPPAAPRSERRPLATCTLPGRPVVCFSWTDAPVGFFADASAPWVELVDADGRSLPRSLGSDDRGVAFVTRVGDLDPGGVVWSILCSLGRGARAVPPGARVAIRVRGAPPLDSLAFSPGALPPACSGAEAARCGAFDDPLPEPPYGVPISGPPPASPRQ